MHYPLQTMARLAAGLFVFAVLIWFIGHLDRAAVACAQRAATAITVKALVGFRIACVDAQGRLFFLDGR